MNQRHAKNTFITAAGTFFSRVLGFLRDILIAHFFGTSPILEAFIVAFRIPNLFRSFFAEGFSDAVATPVLAEFHMDHKRLFQIGNNLLFLLAIVLCGGSLLGIVFSRVVVICVAPGFLSQPATFAAAESFLRITFIYLFLVGLSSVFKSLFYALRIFTVPAFTPCFLNITFIIGLSFFYSVLKEYVLVTCVVIAGVAELFVSFYYLRKEGFRLTFRFKEAFRDTAIARMVTLFFPRVWSAIVYHLNVIIDTVLSSFSMIVGFGALAAIYFSNRVIQFPFAVIALSISRVAMVEFSYYHKEGKMDEFKKLFIFSLQNILVFIVPMSIVLVFNSSAIIRLLFSSGQFNEYSVAITSSVLFFYSFGLFFFCSIKIMVLAFYALKDTVTPAKLSTVALFANVIFSVMLMFPLKIGGIALGSTLAAAINCLLLYKALVKKIGRFQWQGTGGTLLKLFGTGLFLALLTKMACSVSFGRFGKIGIIIFSNVLFYFIIGKLLKISQIEKMLNWLHVQAVSK